MLKIQAPRCIRTVVAPLKRMVRAFKPVLTADVFETTIIDIHSKGKFPANVLSNFTSSKFKLDGVRINSLEGFLQSLKTSDTKLQRKICRLTGTDAKKAGTALNASGFDRVNLFWNGKNINRLSEDYQNLLKRAFNERFRTDATFRNALEATKGKTLTHSIGLQSPQETILTEKEFIELLEDLRAKL